jgi:hypothetical protein
LADFENIIDPDILYRLTTNDSGIAVNPAGISGKSPWKSAVARCNNTE